MAYHFPNERRRIERRQHPSPAYAGPERRLAERRNTEVKLVRDKQPINRTLLWVAVLTVLVVVDASCLDGYYRHQFLSWFNGLFDGIRYWSAHLWGWER
jgi:hypothetical protein